VVFHRSRRSFTRADSQRRLVATTTSSEQTPKQAASQSLSANPMVVRTPSIVQYGTDDSSARPLFFRLEGSSSAASSALLRRRQRRQDTGRLVVRRDSIDSDNGTKWSYCQVGPLDMLDSLRDGTVYDDDKFRTSSRSYQCSRCGRLRRPVQLNPNLCSRDRTVRVARCA
jgi:hypothetical protein